MNKDKDEINEYAGNIVPFDTVFYPVKSSDRPMISPVQEPVTFSAEPKLMNWQEDIVRIITTTNHNIIVNASPSAGKTLPLLKAWSELLISWADSQLSGHVLPIPKLLFVTPTRQLANQAYIDIRAVYTRFLLRIANDPKYTSIKDRILGVVLDPNINQHQSNDINTQINKQITIDTGSGATSRFGITSYSDNSIALIATYKIAYEALEKSRTLFKLIVIDEIQEYLNKPVSFNDYKEDRVVDKEKLTWFSNIIKSAHHQANLILMTGSTNYNTTEAIKHIIIKLTGKTTELIHENVPNRSHINVVPSNNLRHIEQLIDLAERIITYKENQSLIILFSVGSIRSMELKKKSILSIADKLIHKTRERSPEQVINAPIKIGLTSSQLHQQNIHNGSNLTNLGNVFNRREGRDLNDLDDLKDMIQGQSTINGVNYKRDHILGKCILHGFGYIMSGREKIQEMGEVENMDTILTQKLFMEGKISLIFATDAVGVGANLKVRNMYISNLRKPLEGSKFGPLDDSSLVQLIHRVGRDPRTIGNIYATPEDAPRILRFLNSDPSKEVASVDISELEKNLSPSRLIEILLRLL